MHNYFDQEFKGLRSEVQLFQRNSYQFVIHSHPNF